MKAPNEEIYGKSTQATMLSLRIRVIFIHSAVAASRINQSINQSSIILLAIITWGKKHREYDQYKWQVQPGRNCAYSCPWNTNKSIASNHAAMGH